jgi:hypothetical protein
MNSLITTAIACLAAISNAETINFKDIGGVSLEGGAEKSSSTAWANGNLVNETLKNLKPYDVFYFPNEYVRWTLSCGTVVVVIYYYSDPDLLQ